MLAPNAAACRALDLPITGGNVSLYNETDGAAIYPTPVLGVVGLLEDAYRVLGRRFTRGKQAEEGEAWALPDLLVVDGGRGQLAVALTAAHDLGLDRLLPLVQQRELAVALQLGEERDARR